MKLLNIIIKSLKEQARSFWVFILTVSMGPFFVFVYYLIYESSKPHYDVLIVNNDTGIMHNSINYGALFIDSFNKSLKDSVAIPFTLNTAKDRDSALSELKSKKTDAVIILPADFSENLGNYSMGDSSKTAEIEFIGDLTNINYLVSAVWAGEFLNSYGYTVTGVKKNFQVHETPVGVSGSINDFDLIVPGLLILSVIMLMFPATIAIISEVENRTIMRLKMSGISALEYLTGVSLVQVLIGIIAVFLTLLTAILLGFKNIGPVWILILFSIVTGISIIEFSLIIAAATKTANEVLIVGNFPMLLFMFFTGSAYPIHSNGLFTIMGYPVSIQGLMSPTHAISALNKVMILEMGIKDVIPELIAILLLSVIYFMIGIFLFQKRHLN